jgi:hypothetical protein
MSCRCEHALFCGRGVFAAVFRAGNPPALPLPGQIGHTAQRAAPGAKVLYIKLVTIQHFSWLRAQRVELPSTPAFRSLALAATDE